MLSVTFRKLAAEEIVALAAKAGLDGIEWGGDIHVPHGDVGRAREVGRLTEDAGLKVAAYGSYYRTGVADQPAGPFETIVETAAALGAPTIRVWAGNAGSAAADARMRALIVEDSRRIAETAQQAGITVSYEYHGNTLTDTIESTVRLLDEVDHPNMRSLWQPRIGASVADNLSELERLAPWLTNVHVYHWDASGRRPLSDGREAWSRYVRRISEVTGGRYAMLEFVKDDDPAQFLEDAAELKRLVESHGRD